MHLSLASAADLAEGHLGDQQSAFWLGHLADCSQCGDRMQEWHLTRAALRRDHLESAPREVYSRAVSIFRNAEVPGNSVEKEPLLRRLIAKVVFDSFQQPALTGVRSAGLAEARQLVLAAAAFDIHARIWTERDLYRLDGQILPSGDMEFFESPVQLSLVVNGQRTQSAVTDRFGEFQFREIPKGELVIEVDLPHLTVVGQLLSSEEESDSGTSVAPS